MSKLKVLVVGPKKSGKSGIANYLADPAAFGSKNTNTTYIPTVSSGWGRGAAAVGGLFGFYFLMIFFSLLLEHMTLTQFFSSFLSYLPPACLRPIWSLLCHHRRPVESSSASVTSAETRGRGTHPLYKLKSGTCRATSSMSGATLPSCRTATP